MMSPWRVLTLEIRGMHLAAYVLGASAVFSSLLAFLRDRLLAAEFGASLPLDIYYAAFRIPDIIFVIGASLVSAYVLIPELSKRGEESARGYLDTVMAWFSLLLVLVSSVAAYSAPLLLSHMFPQFVDMGYLNELTQLTRIILLQPILLGLSNIFAAVTQARERYALYAATPLLYNIGIIVGIVALYPAFGLPGLAWGVVLGAFLHLAIQVPSVLLDGFFTRTPRIAPLSSLWSTISISIPRSLALSFSQLAFLGLVTLAGSLSEGSISIFMLAFNLQGAPLAVIGASYSVAAFPKLAQMFSRGEKDEFINHLSSAARHIFFWSLPAIALVIVLRAYIVRVVLGSGSFDWTDTRLTAASLALFSVALAAQGLTLLLVRGYYAAGKTRAPVVITFCTSVLTIGLAYALVHVFDDRVLLSGLERLMRVSGVPGSAVLALSFAYALSATIGCAVLVAHFERNFGGFLERQYRTIVDGIIAAIAGGAAAYTMLAILGDISPLSTFMQVLITGVTAGCVGLIAIGITYHVLGNREFEETVRALSRRMRIAPVASAEDVSSH